MLNIDFTFLCVLVNLLVLYLIVRKLLFKRVGDIIDARARAIQSDIDSGRKNRADAEELRKKYERDLDSAREECGAIIEDAHRRARSEYEQIIDGAKREAAAIIGIAREKAESERSAAFRKLSDDVVELVIAASSKVVEANMNTERNRKLVTEFMRGRGAA